MKKDYQRPELRTITCITRSTLLAGSDDNIGFGEPTNSFNIMRWPFLDNDDE